MNDRRTPYDTGVRAEPKPWVMSGPLGGYMRIAENADRFGKVDFDDDSGDTLATVHAERAADGTWTMQVYLHDPDVIVNVVRDDETTTLASPAADSPDAAALIEERYFGYAYAPSLSTINETPFVLGSIQEGRELVAAIRDGRAGVTVREYRAGTIVESTTSFVGAQTDDVQMALYRSASAVPDIGDSHPDVLVKVGPRGGVSYERL